MSRSKYPTPDSVVAAILQRRDSGLPLNSSAVVRDDEALMGAARRLFGAWQAAIEEAGLDYAAIRSPRADQKPAGYWTKERILALARERLLQGLDMAPGRVRTQDSRLYSAAVYHFGSWEAVVRELGLDYDQVRLTGEWTQERVLDTLRELYAQGADLSERCTYETRGNLYGACYTHFGSYRAAVEAAGIPYQEVRRTEEWTQERVIAELQRLAKLGPVNTKTAPSPLHYAVMRYFGGWRAALDAASIPREGNLQYYWTRELVLERLQARLAAGLSCRANDLKREDLPLWAAASKHFGGVNNALEAMSIPVNRKVGGRRPGAGRKQRQKPKDDEAPAAP